MIRPLSEIILTIVSLVLSKNFIPATSWLYQRRSNLGGRVRSNLNLLGSPWNKMALLYAASEKNTFEIDTKESNAMKPKKEIEVEQKFMVSPENIESIEKKLKSLNFERTSQLSFTDTYYDLPTSWCLSLNNIWLRYRSSNDSSALKGRWQLKRGIENENTNATIYEEMEGDDAINTALDFIALHKLSENEQLLCMNNSDNHEDDENDGIPIKDGETMQNVLNIIEEKDNIKTTCIASTPFYDVIKKVNLVPFAKFETQRSSWIMQQDSSIDQLARLRIDLDGTNFGFMVGEVEIILQDDEYNPQEMKAATDLLDSFIKTHFSTSTDFENESGQGHKASKLAIYMKKYCPDHYDACIKAGVIDA